MYSASKHIQHWLKTNKAEPLPIAIATQLGRHLAGLPWLPGGGLDWNQLAGNRLDLSALTKELLDDWLRSTVMGGHSHFVFFWIRRKR